MSGWGGRCSTRALAAAGAPEPQEFALASLRLEHDAKLYYALNRALRERKAIVHPFKRWQGFLYFLMQALGKLPRFQGPSDGAARVHGRAACSVGGLQQHNQGRGGGQALRGAQRAATKGAALALTWRQRAQHGFLILIKNHSNARDGRRTQQIARTTKTQRRTTVQSSECRPPDHEPTTNLTTHRSRTDHEPTTHRPRTKMQRACACERCGRFAHRCAGGLSPRLEFVAVPASVYLYTAPAVVPATASCCSGCGGCRCCCAPVPAAVPVTAARCSQSLDCSDTWLWICADCRSVVRDGRKWRQRRGPRASEQAQQRCTAVQVPVSEAAHCVKTRRQGTAPTNAELLVVRGTLLRHELEHGHAQCAGGVERQERGRAAHRAACGPVADARGVQPALDGR